MRYRAVIFDMDGTILDTAGDLADALNHALKKAGHRHDFTVEDAKHFFGSGVQVAIKRALALEAGMTHAQLVDIGTRAEILPEGITGEVIGEIQKIYEPYYASHCAIKTGPYPGIVTLLKRLRAAGIMTAVVSNKPDEAVQILTEEQFPGLFDLAVGLRTTVRRKPAPDVTLKAVEELGISVEDAVYIGDSEIDLQTAANAGMDCISVDWGFRGAAFLADHGAKKIVSRAEEIFAASLT